MNIGVGAALFMWLLVLWPLIVGIAYPLVRRPQVSNAPALAVLSIVVGYVLVAGVIKLSEVAENAFGNLWLLSFALLISAPPLATHVIFTNAGRSDGSD